MVISTGSSTPLGQVSAPTEAAVRSAVPALSRVWGGSVTAVASTEPAAWASEPSGL
ncbi:hypothetical protein D3C85_1089770 [compost metagenome]